MWPVQNSPVKHYLWFGSIKYGPVCHQSITTYVIYTSDFLAVTCRFCRADMHAAFQRGVGRFLTPIALRP